MNLQKMIAGLYVWNPKSNNSIPTKEKMAKNASENKEPSVC